MKMIVGLGNIGPEYNYTRHNVGFMILDSFSFSFHFEKKFEAYVSLQKIEDVQCLFVKPTTFMNLSGSSVIKIAHYYHIDPRDILIVHDDLDLPFGKIRLKMRGSSGGHNGIKSIIENLKTEEFCRLKMGIGHDSNIPTVDYVLGHFSNEQIQYIESQKKVIEDIFLEFVTGNFEKAMNQYNGK